MCKNDYIYIYIYIFKESTSKTCPYLIIFFRRKNLYNTRRVGWSINFCHPPLDSQKMPSSPIDVHQFYVGAKIFALPWSLISSIFQRYMNFFFFWVKKIYELIDLLVLWFYNLIISFFLVILIQTSNPGTKISLYSLLKKKNG